MRGQQVSASNTVTITVTRGQAIRLLGLVRQEARALGYGKVYFSDEPANWPPALKRLRTIARKLQDAIYPNHSNL